MPLEDMRPDGGMGPPPACRMVSTPLCECLECEWRGPALCNGSTEQEEDPTVTASGKSTGDVGVGAAGAEQEGEGASSGWDEMNGTRPSAVGLELRRISWASPARCAPVERPAPIVERYRRGPSLGDLPRGSHHHADC
jgi:hypothetical protein